MLDLPLKYLFLGIYQKIFLTMLKNRFSMVIPYRYVLYLFGEFFTIFLPLFLTKIKLFLNCQTSNLCYKSPQLFIFTVSQRDYFGDNHRYMSTMFNT